MFISQKAKINKFFLHSIVELRELGLESGFIYRERILGT